MVHGVWVQGVWEGCEGLHKASRFNYYGALMIHGARAQGLPATEKTYHFKEIYIETIVRDPKKVGLFGYKV